MIILHTRPFDPLSRAIKIALGEKHANFHTIEAPIQGVSTELLNIDKRGRTPVLIDNLWGNGAIIPDAIAAFEYIEDINPVPPLYPSDPLEKANVRVKVSEINSEFLPLLNMVLQEKILKFSNNNTYPDTKILREIRDRVKFYIAGIDKYCIKHQWLATEKMSVVDIIAVAQISILDYFDLINWDKYDNAKVYYQSFKQRPSFKIILEERLGSFPPSPQYGLIDF